MRTRSRIKARIGQYKTLNRATPDDVFADDLVNVRRLNKPVPDLFRIDHYDRSMLALFQASGLVGADRRTQAGRSDLLFE